ncbi:MAG: hypothetical protein JNG88_16520, partial [Phycisphaerales bacterium]|nr:hypothetical protein [Phycisphaerales bacterium]
MNDMPARVPSEEFELALSHALAVPPNFEPAPARVVAGFLASAEHAVLSWIAYRIGSRGAPSALAIGLLLRGRTVLILPAGRPTTRFDAAATTAVFGALLSDLDQQPYTYAQCILGDGCEPLARVVQSAGFARLTGLRYLERDARYPWIEPPPGELAWLTYTPQRHSEFCAAVAATYVDTHDCPELVGCRTMDDVLAAHRSAGPFEPALWALLLYNDRPAGVLLCTNHGRTFEIVYVGVI